MINFIANSIVIFVSSVGVFTKSLTLEMVEESEKAIKFQVVDSYTMKAVNNVFVWFPKSAITQTTRVVGGVEIEETKLANWAQKSNYVKY